MFRIVPRSLLSGWVVPVGAVLFLACHDGADRMTLRLDDPPADISGAWTLLAFDTCPTGQVCTLLGYPARYLTLEDGAGALALVEYECCGGALGAGTGLYEGTVLRFDLDCTVRSTGDCQIQECDSGTGSWNGTAFEGELINSRTISGPAEACPVGSLNNRLGFSLRSGWGACSTSCPDDGPA